LSKNISLSIELAPITLAPYRLACPSGSGPAEKGGSMEPTRLKLILFV